MSLKIKILRESIRSFSYLQDVLTWSNSLDDTTCTDSQSWTSWRCSGYTTHCLSFIVVSKIFLMVKSTQLCGEKQREDVNLVTPDTRQCDCLCSRARAPRAFFFTPIKASPCVARAWNWLSASSSEISGHFRNLLSQLARCLLSRGSRD